MWLDNLRSGALRRANAGFSLLEIGLVIIVISLIVGGVLIARDVVRNAQIYKLTDQYATYTQAVQLFRDKYKAAPGDFPLATSIWGADSTCPNTTRDAASQVPKTVTCNGDGDGRVGLYDADNGVNSNVYETFRFWQHLANAGFLQNRFSGVAGPDGAEDTRFALSQPAAALSGTGWFARDLVATSSGNAVQYPVFNGLILFFAGDNGTQANALSPAEMQLMDQKSDDGRPATGNIVVYQGRNLTCTTSTNVDTAEYKVAETGRICTPALKMEE